MTKRPAHVTITHQKFADPEKELWDQCASSSSWGKSCGTSVALPEAGSCSLRSSRPHALNLRKRAGLWLRDRCCTNPVLSAIQDISICGKNAVFCDQLGIYPSNRRPLCTFLFLTPQHTRSSLPITARVPGHTHWHGSHHLWTCPPPCPQTIVYSPPIYRGIGTYQHVSSILSCQVLALVSLLFSFVPPTVFCTSYMIIPIPIIYLTFPPFYASLSRPPMYYFSSGRGEKT